MCRIISILVVIWFHSKGVMLILVVLLPLILAFTRHVQKNMLSAKIRNRKAVGRASGHVPVILILNAVVVAVVMLLSVSGNPVILTFFGMSAGTALAIMNYISQIFTPVESLGMEIQTIQSALAGIYRINEFYELEEEMPDDVKIKDIANESRKTTPVVLFDDVRFGYDEHAVLDHVSFHVEEGEQVTLSGRTGAGKSTLFKLLLGLYEPQEGEVLVGGIPAGQLTEKERRKWFGYVEQSYHMVPGTIRDQITLYDESITEEQSWQNRRSCFWMRLLQTWMPRRNTRCCRH